LRVELPSGATVDVRERLRGKDKFDVHGAIKFTAEQGKEQTVSGAVTDNMRNALLAGIITAWTVTDDNGNPVPIPSENAASPEQVFGDMDIDDYNALQEAVEPLMEKVSFKAPNQPTASA
jgi:hypothetical protein